MPGTQVQAPVLEEEELEEWFPTKESKQDLEVAKGGREEFRKWILSIANETYSPVRKKSSKRQEKSEEALSVQDAFGKKTYEGAVAIVAPFLVIDELGTAGAAQAYLVKDRESSRVRRLGQGVEKFASTFNKFLQATKRIVGIASGADPIYIAIAYETLSVFFTVLASRQKVEDDITRTIADMNERLPDLIVYDRIYKNAVLGKKIAVVYKGIVQFSRDAAKYYSTRHGYKRWGYILGRSEKFSNTNATFKSDMVAVRNQCELLLSANVDRLTSVPV